MQHADGYVRSEIDHGIATIEFYHPASNSLPSAILTDLAKTINDYGIDDRIKVIVLRSAGDKAFCAGASFDELTSITNEAGGGVGIVAATDYCIALDTSSVKLSELAVGIGPFVVGPAVERKTGVSAYSQLAIDATEWRSAEWAKKHGLYAELHHTIEELDDAVLSLAQRLSHSSPEAMLQLKKVFWHGTEIWDPLLSERAAISGKLVLSDFTRNAIAAFKAKTAK